MILEQTGPLAPHHRPWQLIRDAVHDLTLQEQTPGYTIEMKEWHIPKEGTCYQCLAGAVMTRRLGVDSCDNATPNQFGASVTMQLLALDQFREGAVRDGVSTLGMHYLYTDRVEDRLITPYEDGPEQFKRDMLDLADYLEEHYREYGE